MSQLSLFTNAAPEDFEIADKFSAEALAVLFHGDPYAGVGTTIAASIRNRRRGAGADTERDYIKIAQERATQAWQGILPVRPMNKPVYKPSGSSSLTQRPIEWKDQ